MFAIAEAFSEGAVAEIVREKVFVSILQKDLKNN
jgi:hypothetical protein